MSKQRIRLAWFFLLAMLLMGCQPGGDGIAQETTLPTEPAISSYLEALFPPKVNSVILEGEEVLVSQIAGGREPEFGPEGALSVPGFAIYYDPELYTLTQEGDVTYLRSPQASDYPLCELSIRHLPGVSPITAADTVRGDSTLNWDINDWDGSEKIGFSFYEGTHWDSPCGDMTFLSDTMGGCFQITAQYFVEATEGHGARFAQMANTFTVIAP